MQAVYDWVRNIVSYLLFIRVLTGILPSVKYEKYIRLFAGCILILLVLRPLTEGLRLEDKIGGLFLSISFENEAGELRGQLEEMEEKRLERLFEQYEEEAAREMSRMAEEEGYLVKSAALHLERSRESEYFGRVKDAELALSRAAGMKNKSSADAPGPKGAAGRGGEEASEEGPEKFPEIAVEAVEPVYLRGEEKPSPEAAAEAGVRAGADAKEEAGVRAGADAKEVRVSQQLPPFPR